MTTTFAGHLLGPDTHANRPAATAVPQGTLYSCSDHGLIYQSDGASWSTWATLGGGGAATTWLEPAASGNGPGGTDDDEFADSTKDAAYTEVTVSGTCTWTEDNDVLSAKFDDQTSADAAAILKAMTSPSSPLTAETAVRLWGANENHNIAGVVLTDGTSGTANAVCCVLQHSASGSTQNTFLRAGTLTSLNASLNVGLTDYVPDSIMPWSHLRIHWDAANSFKGGVSPDGVSWFETASQSFTMTPTHVGLLVTKWGGTKPAVASFEFLRIG